MSGETSGKARFYEDFEVGQILRHPNGRTVTEADNIWFSLVTNNTNPIHYDRLYCERNFPGPPFNGRMLVNATLTLAILIGLSVEDTSKHGMMLGLSNMKIPNPVFPGDTLYAESVVVGKRDSESHRGMGIITIKTTGYNQDRKLVMEFERTFLARKRGEVWMG